MRGVFLLAFAAFSIVVVIFHYGNGRSIQHRFLCRRMVKLCFLVVYYSARQELVVATKIVTAHVFVVLYCFALLCFSWDIA
jgi:hypothetical protein